MCAWAPSASPTASPIEGVWRGPVLSASRRGRCPRNCVGPTLLSARNSSDLGPLQTSSGCHPERSGSSAQADDPTESKDPYSLNDRYPTSQSHPRAAFRSASNNHEPRKALCSQPCFSDNQANPPTPLRRAPSASIRSFSFLPFGITRSKGQTALLGVLLRRLSSIREKSYVRASRSLFR